MDIVPAGYGECEYIEKRSRFVGRVWKVSAEEEALELLAQMRKQYSDASHNVYAFSLRSGAARSSDDGEPAGTGGRPIMEVFSREGVSDFLCVVTRWFGGILLGAGGLTRAYAHTASLALDAAGVAELRRVLSFETVVPYSFIEKMKVEIASAHGVFEDAEYTADVRVFYSLPEAEADRFSDRICELSSGSILPRPSGDRMLPIPTTRKSRLEK